MNPSDKQDLKRNWVKSVVLFLSSQSLSLLGSSIIQYAIMWHITLETESGIMVTIYILCGFIPTFIITPLAGVWADRYNRKILIILSDGGIAASTFILVILYGLGLDSIELLFLMSAVRAVGAGIQTPAVNAILPQFVPQEKLTKVNGINSSIQAVIAFLAPMASAALIAQTSMQNIFMIDVLTAVLAMIILFFCLKIPSHQKAAGIQNESYLNDLKLGIQYVNDHRFLKVFFTFYAILFFLIAPAAFLVPLQITRNFGEEVWRLSAIEVAYAVGMLLGGGLVAYFGSFANKIKISGISGTLIGACTFGLGLSGSYFWYLMTFMASFGLAVPFFTTPSTVLIQESVDESYLGRIFGILNMIATAMMPLGMLIFGPLADVIAIEWLLMVTGVLLIILSVSLALNKTLIAASKANHQVE